jgi:hypothetical protein
VQLNFLNPENSMMKSARNVVFLLSVVAISAMERSAWGAIITSDPSLPPTSGGYSESTPVSYGGGAIMLAGVVHSPQGTASVTTTGNNEFETFNSILTGLVSVGGSPFMPFTLSGPVQTEVKDKVSQTGTFDTQMLSLDLTGTVGGHAIEVMLDPAKPTVGQTTITAEGGGLFKIDSFFDVFTELSLDNGSFIPQDNGPTHVQLEPVPEPTTIISGALLLLTFGPSALRMLRKQARTG